MTQKTYNYLALALDDYRAARLLLRQGLLAQGVAIASTAVEKELKAVLGLKGVFSKKHLDNGLLITAVKHFPALEGSLNSDFVKYLNRGFQLRYATIDGAGYGIVINQYRTLVALDGAMLTIDSGLKLQANSEPHPTPLQRAIADGDPLILADNVHLKQIQPNDLLTRPNKMLELKVGKDLQTLIAEYETDGLNIIGDFCKKTDMDFGKVQFKFAMG
jgi:uncharacterized protein (UPF0332 family)